MNGATTTFLMDRVTKLQEKIFLLKSIVESPSQFPGHLETIFKHPQSDFHLEHACIVFLFAVVSTAYMQY